MKTDKFNRMIEAFECDFSLIKEGKRTFASLDKVMKDSRYSLSEDMELMQELSTMLRYGQAEIHLTEKPMTNADAIRNMTDGELEKFIEQIVYYCRGRQNDKYCEDCPLFKCRVCNGTYISKWLQAEVEEGA